MTDRLPRIIAHRGASMEAPENTLASFRRAVECGARAIEFDVHLTRDGAPVVIHDPFLDRTTNGSGAVADATLDEVRALDAGTWFDPAFAGERVPTLDEVLALAAEHDLGVNVEVKIGEEEPYEGVEEKIGDALKRAGLLEQAFVSSFHPPYAERFRKLYPGSGGVGVILLGPLEPEHLEDATWADAVGLYVDCATPESIRAAHDAKKMVVAWTVNDPARAKALFADGVDAVITDDPRALKSVQ